MLPDLIFSQTLGVYQGFNKLSDGSIISFPPAAANKTFLTFTIVNEGDKDLELTGDPLIWINKEVDFFLVKEPSVSSISPGDSAFFTVKYFPFEKTQSPGKLYIQSNDPLNGTFILNLTGPGNALYSTLNPWYGTSVIEITGDQGYAGGQSIDIKSVSIADKTGAFWGPSVDDEGAFQLRLSLDGFEFSKEEIFSFVPEESNLANGILVWKGSSVLSTAVDGSFPKVYTRATLRTQKGDGSAFPLIAPESLGLTSNLGGLIKFESSNDVLKANMLIEASFSPDSDFIPYYEFFEANTIPEDPSPAYLINNEKFYWFNLTPSINLNSLVLNEGNTATLSTAYIQVDDEDVLLNPDKLVFRLGAPGERGNPFKNNTGFLILENDTLNNGDDFTYKNILDGKLIYHNNGSEVNNDEFNFQLWDSRYVEANDGSSSTFKFNIDIVPVDDSPIALEDTFSISFKEESLTGNVSGIDPEGNTLSFELIDNPSLGTLSLLADGSFIYQSAATKIATDFFTFRASDGTNFSKVAKITIELINTPPTAITGEVYTKKGVSVNGILTATDKEDSELKFRILQNGSKGVATVADDGSFTYVPNGNIFGKDVFTFEVEDNSGNISSAETFAITITPTLEEGDLLIADGDKIRLFDPAISQDAVIFEGGNLIDVRNMFYKTGTSLFVMDANAGLLKIDPSSGAQTLLADISNFSMVPSDPVAPSMIMDRNGSLIIADGINGIIKADTATGVIAPIFQGGELQFASGIALLKNGDLLVGNAGVFLGGETSILKISPNNNVVNISKGDKLFLPTDLCLIDQKNIYVSNGASFGSGVDNVLKINIEDGSQEVVSNEGDLDWPTGIDFNMNTKQLYVINQESKLLLAYNNGIKSEQPTEDGFVNPFGLFAIQKSNVNPVVKDISSISGKYGTLFNFALDTLVSDESDLLSELHIEVKSSNVGSVYASLSRNIVSLIFLASGSADVAINVEDTDGGKATTVFKVFVDKEKQYITFDPISDQEFGEKDFIITANSDSQLPITFYANSSNIIVENNRVTMIAPGLASIIAKQEGNDEYSAAEPVIRNFCVNPLPPVITDVRFDNETVLLTSSLEDGNQWYFNNKLLEGETSNAVVATETGLYGAKTIIEGCESAMSDMVSVEITGINAQFSVSKLKAFPMPAQDYMTVEFENPAKEFRTFEIMDLTGRLVYSEISDKEQLNIDMNELSSGMYTLKISNSEKSVTKSIIKK